MPIEEGIDLRAIYRNLITAHGLRPYEIDLLTLKQVALYFDADDSQPPSQEDIEARKLSVYRKGIADRLETAGYEVPEDIDQLQKEALDRLWNSSEGVV